MLPTLHFFEERNKTEYICSLTFFPFGLSERKNGLFGQINENNGREGNIRSHDVASKEKKETREKGIETWRNL